PAWRPTQRTQRVQRTQTQRRQRTQRKRRDPPLARSAHFAPFANFANFAYASQNQNTSCAAPTLKRDGNSLRGPGRPTFARWLCCPVTFNTKFRRIDTPTPPSKRVTSASHGIVPNSAPVT